MCAIRQHQKKNQRQFFFAVTFLSIFLFAASCASSLSAAAQGLDNKDSLEKEFSAFKEKIEKAKQVNADKAPDTGISNPLGPAANLPVDPTKNVMATDVMMPSTPQDVQAEMEAQAAAQEKQLRERAFKEALKGLLPLSTDEIRQTLDAFRINRRAVEEPLQVPVPATQIKTVSLDPTADPLTINTAPGYVTTISILDSTGAPWPIQDISYAGKFTVTPPESGGNLMRIVPGSAHGAGNLSMRLVDLITPVVFTLTTGLDSVDYRIDARLPKPGPLAKTSLIEFGGLDATAGGDENLTSVLDGVIPKGAEKLRVKGVDARTAAWRVDGTVYLRTSLSLLSPTWKSSASSADGTTVYTLNDAPVFLLSDNGRMVQARIVGADEVKP